MDGSNMTEDIGKLILRVSVGVLILLHGISKLQSGISGIVGMLESHGLPSFLAYGVYLGEVVGPVLVIIGLFTRVGAVLMIGNMVVAFALAHMQELFRSARWVAGHSNYKACSFSVRSPSHYSVPAGIALAGSTDASIKTDGRAACRSL